MPRFRQLSFLIAVVVVSLACGVPLARPTETSIPTATATPLPTSTPTPLPTATEIVPTPTSTSVPDLPMPAGEPLSAWKGIPVMPGAIAGDEINQFYAFVIDAPVEDVAAFYEKKLPELGWQKFATGQGQSGTLMLIFKKASALLTITLLPQAEGKTYVMLLVK